MLFIVCKRLYNIHRYYIYIDANALNDKLGSLILVQTLKYYGFLKDQDVVNICEQLKAYCSASDFQSLQGILNMDIAEDQQFWDYIKQCVQIQSQPTTQQIPFQQIPSQGIPCQYYPTQPLNFAPPTTIPINPQQTERINFPPSPPN